MNKQTNNGWTHNGHDTMLNGALLAAGMLGLFLAVLDAPMHDAAPVMAGVIASEALA